MCGALTPASLGDGLVDSALMFPFDAVAVEDSVEVVELVLKDSREPPFRFYTNRIAVPVSTAEYRSAVSGEGGAFAGNR